MTFIRCPIRVPSRQTCGRSRQTESQRQHTPGDFTSKLHPSPFHPHPDTPWRDTHPHRETVAALLTLSLVLVFMAHKVVRASHSSLDEVLNRSNAAATRRDSMLAYSRWLTYPYAYLPTPLRSRRCMPRRWLYIRNSVHSGPCRRLSWSHAASLTSIQFADAAIHVRTHCFNTCFRQQR